METAQLVLTVIGAIAIGIPLVLRAIYTVLVMIPNDQGEEKLLKVIEWADKIGGFLTGLLPKSGSAQSTTTSEPPKV